MAGPRYFVGGKCRFCAQSGCNEHCIHWGGTTCVKTLLAVGERLYLEGNDEAGVKYYGLGLYARDVFGYDKLAPPGAPPVSPRKKEGTGSFESVQGRYATTEAYLRGLRSSGRGVFGVYTPTPINHEAGMSFQHRRNSKI